MSFRTVSISAENIGKIPVCLEKDENNISTVLIGGTEFKIWKFYHDDNTIAFMEHASSHKFNDIVDILLEILPETEFKLHCYNHDGYGFDCKCGMYDGKEVDWDFERYDVLDGFEADEYGRIGDAYDIEDECCDIEYEYEVIDDDGNVWWETY